MERASIAKNKLFLAAVVIALLNPIFSGLIIGLVMFTESELKREGRIVTAFAIIWGILALALLAKFRYLLAI
ncbi:MAG: hypothetical protein HY474_01955 [Candidatus Sungbacteria bacterium]|uniref:Uncharacterized protein n=1 Tax=Candidatus Sungiibacteriota bacterium TaxID=2750080 RepID=A0A932YVX5_9BACT|nr:hypothetical protein [Candidatus Sungbacteria bacterium]